MKTRIAVVCVFLVLAFMPLRLFAQSETIRSFHLTAETSNMDKNIWIKMYERVRKNLETSLISGDKNYYPGRLLYKMVNSPYIRLMTFDESIPLSQALDGIMNYMNVEYAQPDYVYMEIPYKIARYTDKNEQASLENPSDSSVPNDPYYKLQPHLIYLGMDKVYERYGFNLGAGADIHVVDSGGGCNHPDVKTENIIPEKDYYDLGDPCSSPFGLDPHGSLILGVMAAVTNNDRGGAGIIPNAKFHIWRVIGPTGSGSTFGIAAALFQIAAQSRGLGNEVINMSLGGARDDPLEDLAISENVDKNILLIAASGNEGRPAISFPAAISSVLAVGATNFPDQNGEKARADYSNYGPGLSLTAVVGDFKDRNHDGKPDGVIAEGTDADGKYGMYVFDGTSAAVPLASATAGLLISMGIRSPTQLKKILTDTADDVPPIGCDEQTGCGSIRADIATGSIDQSLPIFGYFSQSAYSCTVESDRDFCEATVQYKLRLNRYTAYLFDNYDGNIIKELKSTDGSEKIKVSPGGITGVQLIYYPNGQNPAVFAETQVFGKGVTYNVMDTTKGLSADGSSNPIFNLGDGFVLNVTSNHTWDGKTVKICIDSKPPTATDVNLGCSYIGATDVNGSLNPSSTGFWQLDKAGWAGSWTQHAEITDGTNTYSSTSVTFTLVIAQNNTL